MRTALIVTLMFFLMPLQGAEAPKSSEKLTKMSTLVVEATVTKVSKKDVVRKDDGRNGKGSVDTYYTITVKVNAVTKDDGEKRGETITVRALQAKKGGGLFGTIWNKGNEKIPAEKKKYKLYLKKKNDGQYWILTPNGCEEIKEAKEDKEKK